MKVEFHDFTDDQRDLFYDIWKDLGLYTEDAEQGNSEPFCCPWFGYTGPVALDTESADTERGCMEACVKAYYKDVISTIVDSELDYYHYLKEEDEDVSDKLEKSLDLLRALRENCEDYGYAEGKDAIEKVLAEAMSSKVDEALADLRDLEEEEEDEDVSDEINRALASLEALRWECELNFYPEGRKKIEEVLAKWDC